MSRYVFEKSGFRYQEIWEKSLSIFFFNYRLLQLQPLLYRARWRKGILEYLILITGISKCVKNMSKYDLNLQITLVELIFRANFHAYCLFSLVNTIVYCIPAGWLWNTNGFLKQLGVVDIAGSGGVHLIGGSSGICNIY